MPRAKIKIEPEARHAACQSVPSTFTWSGFQLKNSQRPIRCDIASFSYEHTFFVAFEWVFQLILVRLSVEKAFVCEKASILDLVCF